MTCPATVEIETKEKWASGNLFMGEKTGASHWICLSTPLDSEKYLDERR